MHCEVGQVPFVSAESPSKPPSRWTERSKLRSEVNLERWAGQPALQGFPLYGGQCPHA